MLPLAVTLVVCLLLGAVLADESDFPGSDFPSYRAPPPAILMYKQALRQDGAFNYLFSAENGLKQGETIAPDGTRHGAYSYVDPSGQTISVKYTAGKDGFRILEGAHVPKSAGSEPLRPAVYAQPLYQPTPAYQQSGGQYPPQSSDQPSFPRSQLLYTRGSSDFNAPSSSSFEDDASLQTSSPIFRSPLATDEIVKPVQEYRSEDVHRGPHTFGPGYSFEFSG